MSLLSRWFGKGVAANTETKAEGDGVITLNMLANSDTMNQSKALKTEAYFSCLRDKAETIGQLPMKLFRVTTKTREQLLSGRNKVLFTERPCDYLSMQGFLEMLVVAYERHGVFYAYMERNDLGQVMSIIPFKNQTSVTTNMDINGNVYYTYSTNDGRPRFGLNADDLFTVSMFTLDGYTPVSPVVQCATLLGISNSQDESYRELQEKGITAQMALATEQIFNNNDAVERLRNQWKDFRGANGRGSMPILEQGLKPVSLKLTPQESELLGNKQFTVNRICRMTRVPPHRVGIIDKNLGASTVADFDEAYMRDSLNPILVKTEHAFNRVTPEGYQVQFNRKAFFAGSPWKLVEAVEREVKGGLASINEGRIDLGRETIEGGDIFAIDNNNVTYGLWTDVKELQAQLYGQTQGNPKDEN